MIERSYNPKVLEEAVKLAPSDMNEGLNCEEWLQHPNNIMLVEGENVTLVVVNSPGVYTLHWFYKSRGKEALEQAHRILKYLFEEGGMKVARGITRVDLKAARWACRKVGFKSYGILDWGDCECELFILTKDDFYGISNG